MKFRSLLTPNNVIIAAAVVAIIYTAGNGLRNMKHQPVQQQQHEVFLKQGDTAETGGLKVCYFAFPPDEGTKTDLMVYHNPRKGPISDVIFVYAHNPNGPAGFYRLEYWFGNPSENKGAFFAVEEKNEKVIIIRPCFFSSDIGKLACSPAIPEQGQFAEQRKLVGQAKKVLAEHNIRQAVNLSWITPFFEEGRNKLEHWQGR